METITFVVQVFLDIERPDPNVLLPFSWVQDRVKVFNQFTLRSLLRQTSQDFHIFLICGRRHKAYTSSLPWHKRITLIYPTGDDRIGATLTYSPRFKDAIPTLHIQELLDFETDYVAISRLDSDDMYHKEAMAEIQGTSKLVYKEGLRTRLLFRMFWKWHRMDRILEQQREASPPFYTHIFPREVYQDKHTLQGLHFNNHRFLGGSRDEAIELSSNKVCVLSHEQNISRIKRGRPLRYMRPCERGRLLRQAPGSTRERREIIKHLEPFGVRGDLI
jgi:hypothetical protein